MRLVAPEKMGPLDGILLAGDIMPWTNCVRWADKVAKHYGVPAVLIAGNHEFYARLHPDRTIDKTIAMCLKAASETESRVTFLDDMMTEIAGVRILGSTLWTDFCLFGAGHQARALGYAGLAMNDFLLCWKEPHILFEPRDSLARHEAAKTWLIKKLPRDKPTIVMTHHCPSAKSVAARFANDELSPAFASKLDSLVEKSGAAVWIHGHTHDSFDYTIGKTRVLCNPRGYLNHELNPNFKPDLVIEVG